MKHKSMRWKWPEGEGGGKAVGGRALKEELEFGVYCSKFYTGTYSCFTYVIF